MAAVVATMVVGPLVKIVMEKASGSLLDQYKVMKGMEEQHDILKRKLPAILDIITDAEQAAANSEQAAARKAGVTAWLEAVKKVAYEANEVFDEFKYEALRRKAKKEGHYKELGFSVVKLFPTHNRFVFRKRMGRKLRKVVRAIEVLVTEMNAFGFQNRQQQPVSYQWREKDQDIFDPKKIISRSRAEDNKNIIDILVSQANNADLTVVPIVGMGGLGKTTLAQLVYNDPEIQKHFNLLIWLCVSDSFDVDSLAKSIVEAAPGKMDDGTEAAPSKKKKTPLEILQNVVSGQRYLLVLDDVWTREVHKWEQLKACLGHGGVGSVVLTTTRDEGVAEMMKTVEAYNLKALEDKFIKEIIEARAFSCFQRKEDRPAVLVNMVDEIVERCRGSPLAATALGSLLRTKTNEEEWRAISSRSSICTEDTGILPILNLSYNDLPSHMKQCFAFCAIFPKDYEIDVDKLIRLWIAHGFIIQERQVRLETIGKHIFNDLASRSFFQDVKQVQSTTFEIAYRGACFSRTTCKIHDLMHDVALSVMEKECALATEELAGKIEYVVTTEESVVGTEEPSQSEWLTNTARHLFVSCKEPERKINSSLENSSPAIKTFLCDSSINNPLQHPSKYSSLQALQLCLERRSFPLKPKHLHQLRYLDLSRSDIKALPEDMSILYNLQTLNLSGCASLCGLPRQMKYMTALRHLYTHGCPNLKSMPRDLGKLTSLQTLTCFVAGSGSACSNVGELGNLNLGGQLQLHHLENMKEEDAKAANLVKKKELTDLELKWSFESDEVVDETSCEDYAKILDKLRPHDGMQAITIHSYRGTTSPTWLAMLQNFVEVHLFSCKKLQWLFSGECDASFKFRNLKKLALHDLVCLERWWEEESDGVQGEEIMFPQLEELVISGCGELRALLGHPIFPNLQNARIMGCPKLQWLFSCDSDTSFAFLNLKELMLQGLFCLERWWEVGNDEMQREEIMFPRLEKLLISHCRKLTALPGHPTFPNLQNACIEECPMLTTVKSPKLSVLNMKGDEAELFQWVATHTTSLTNLELTSPGDYTEATSEATERSLKEMVDIKEKMDGHDFPLTVLVLRGFKSGVTELCACLVHLQELSIFRCDALVHWPEKEFQGLVSLRKLVIKECHNLTGYAQASAKPSTSSETSQLLPRLKSLIIYDCRSLIEVFNVPASLRKMDISGCSNLESPFGRKLQQGQSALTQQSSSITEVSSSSSAGAGPEHLEELVLWWCHGLRGVLHLPSFLKKLEVRYCDGLTSVESRSGVLPSLERLVLAGCNTLSSLPDGLQSYSSLQSLIIKDCHGMKTLPTSLQQRLGSIEREYIDYHYYGKPMLLKPKTWKYVCKS